MTVIDKEGEICDMDKKETFGGEIAKQLPVKDIYNDLAHPALSTVGQGLQGVTKLALAPISALVWGYDKIADYLDVAIPEYFEKRKKREARQRSCRASFSFFFSFFFFLHLFFRFPDSAAYILFQICRSIFRLNTSIWTLMYYVKNPRLKSRASDKKTKTFICRITFCSYLFPASSARCIAGRL